MARYLTLQDLHTGCSRKPRYLHPKGVVLDFDPENRRVITWVKQEKIRRVPDSTPLTDPAEVRKKMMRLIRG